ncbi:flagellar hook-associated protein FlgL [Ammoniphilus sp. YIM 78166]|uniref:flagellar hook-associated protein FlgL n=1 Tax=Ammoniphilus sp. YIM 78166 TaxID=1644106 RepID=UPI00107017D5|nr:flagellar hook-associated protein FlgL [Ammoniphilus sp. YIM 78166]
MNLRVTQSMLHNNMIRNVNQGFRKMEILHEQIASGRRISKPSDDPVGAMRGMQYRTQLLENETYKRNANEAKSWMETTDNLISNAGEAMHRVRELMVLASNGTLETSDRKAIASELGQIKEHLGMIANTAIGGRYIFSGTKTDQPPYSIETGMMNSNLINDGEMKVEVSNGVYMAMNVSAKSLFESGEGVFNTIDKVLSDLADSTKSGKDFTTYMEKFDLQHQHMLTIQSALGGRINRVELASDRLDFQEVAFTRLLSQNEDTDFAKAISELNAQEAVHKAALGAGARIIQPTLMDYLR